MRSRSAAAHIDLATPSDAVSPAARMVPSVHYTALAARTTPVPEAWAFTSQETRDCRGVTSIIEVRLANAGHRLAIVRRRLRQ